MHINALTGITCWIIIYHLQVSYFDHPVKQTDFEKQIPIE